MPVSCQIYNEKRLVVTRVSGKVDSAEMLAHARAMLADPSMGATERHLIDYRGSDFSWVGREASEDLARDAERLTANRHPGGYRTAMLVSSDLQFGLKRIYASLADSQGSGAHQVMVFRDWGEALQWLGLPLDFLAA